MDFLILTHKEHFHILQKQPKFQQIFIKRRVSFARKMSEFQVPDERTLCKDEPFIELKGGYVDNEGRKMS